MGQSLVLESFEQARVLNLLEALSTSLDLRELLDHAYTELLALVSADCGALAVSSPERPLAYDWIVARLPPAFLGEYERMAPDDFVYKSVVVKPNVVLRDAEMISRRDLQENSMYARAVQCGCPLERVMAVMLHVHEDFRSGLSLYREKDVAFTERESAILQRLVPALGNTVANCRTFERLTGERMVLDALLESQGLAVVVMGASGREVARSGPAVALLDRWFAPVERAGTSVPRVLLDELAKRARRQIDERNDGMPWVRSGAGADLHVRFLPLARPQRAWALVLKVLPHEEPLPAVWTKLLTPTEQKVASRAIRGWSNEEIARDLGCAEGTVKTHVYRIFNKVGVKNRTALMHRAALLR